jgi:hypothetical protein
MKWTRVTAVVVALAGAIALTDALANSGAAAPAPASGAFAWLHPATPPAGWKLARIPGGAALAYPPEWTPIKTDPGTASVALLAADGRIDAYLNATPRMGAETLDNWRQFRPHHNRAEGERDVRLLASIRDVSFRSGHGACVIDSYTTSRTSYREIACLVSAARSSAVVVAAAPIALFDRHAATLQRAVSSFTA